MSTAAAADRHDPPARSVAGSRDARVIASGQGWSIAEFTCRLGPQDRPFEERHDAVTVAAVLEGSFLYRSDAGEALLHPGSFLLGNAGACFRCAHDHGAGDRCVSFRFAPSLFEEIAASAAGSHRFRFASPMLPAVPALAPMRLDAELAADGGEQSALEERAIGLAEAVLAAASGRECGAASPSARDRRRIADAVHHVEAQAERPLRLADLAGVACMSKYHFLRTFRRTVGVSPYQYLLAMRLRRAALALCTTATPVAEIALACGFGDLSTFNARFRAVMGMSPRTLRRLRKHDGNDVRIRPPTARTAR